MSAAPHLVLTGRAVVVGKQPDGDSVRFAPDDPALLGRLEHGDRVHVSSDGSVQLRLDGVDAPELHYRGLAQPLGAAARDDLLLRLGFAAVGFAADGSTVLSATPPTVPVVVLARLVEVNGRPVAVVLAGDAAADLAGSGGETALTPDLLRRSVNAEAIAAGAVYPLLYTSTPAAARAVLRDLARSARAIAAGVWARDASAAFPVADARALGPDGALVWPKLFRRATDRLAAPPDGRTLPEWLAGRPLEDDDVVVEARGGPAPPVPLHTLLEQDGAVVRLVPDLLDLLVVEREEPAGPPLQRAG